MKRTHLIATALVLATALAACGRESTTVVGSATPTAPEAPAAASAAPAVTPPQAQAATGAYNEGLEGLLKATQGLSASIQALSQRPAGPMRTVAIAQAHQALAATNQAALRLPPEMRADAVGATGASGTLGSQPDNPQSMEALQKAADALRQSVQTVVDEAPGERRNEAIKATHKALNETNQAMIQIPPRSPAGK